MALEQITGEVVTDDQDQDKDQPAPKSKLAAMKKKVKTMDTELRSKVPVKQVQKEDEDFVTAMQDQYKNRPADAGKENNKSKLLTPERTMEVADSLNYEARKQVYSKLNKTTKIEDHPEDYNKYVESRKKYDDKAGEEFKKNPDMINSKRYKALALQAMSKNK